MVTFVDLIFTFCFSNFCMELRTSGVGWLHDSILSPPSFLSTFCKELGTSSVRWLHFFISSLHSFLSTFCQELRTSGVGWLHCSILVLPSVSNTFCKELWTSNRLTTPPQRHLTNSLQTACGHLTIFTSPHPPLSVEYGGGVRRGVRGDLSLTDFHPPP